MKKVFPQAHASRHAVPVCIALHEGDLERPGSLIRAVDALKIIPVLVEAVKELELRVEALENA